MQVAQFVAQVTGEDVKALTIILRIMNVGDIC
jgi:hypothetical protein